MLLSETQLARPRGEKDAMTEGEKKTSPIKVLANAGGAVKDAAAMAVDKAKPVAGKAADKVNELAKAAAKTGTEAAIDAYAAMGGSTELKYEGNVVDSNGLYLLPAPLVNDAEDHELTKLDSRYKKLTKEGFIAKAGKKAGEIVPAKAKDIVKSAIDDVKENSYYVEAMKIVAEGFGKLEEQAARVTVSNEYVINCVNSGKQEEKISSLRELCLLRSYDISQAVQNEKGNHLKLALTEGAATGVPGFAGIPFNLVFCTFLLFRAVQSIAMFYGYDVKGDPDELAFAGEVLMSAMSGGEDKQSKNATGVVGKIMAISEGEVIKSTMAKGWTAMAQHGGIELVIVQMRALAHAAAEKALQKAGQEGLEKSVFAGIFKQIGKRLSQKAVLGAVPVVSGAIGALFDFGLMSRVIDFADVVYHKRFIAEKAFRVRALTEGKTIDEVFAEDGIEAVDVTVEEPDGEEQADLAEPIEE